MKTGLGILCLLVSHLVFAAAKTWTGNTSINWATATNWSGNSLPASGDDITIPTSPAGGRMPTISADYTIKSLTIQSGATLTHSGGVLSVLTGVITVTGTYSMSGGTLLTDGTVTISSGGQINQSGGTFHLANAIGTNPTDQLSISANGNYTLSTGTAEIKDLTTTAGSPNGTFTQTGGTFRLFHDFKNKGAYTASGGTIEFAGTAGGASFPVEVTSSNTQFYHVQINASVDPKFDNQVVSFNVAGDWTNNSSGLDLSGKATTVIFNGTGVQSIGGSQSTTFRHFTIDKPSGTATLNRNQTVSGGDLSISSGTLDLVTYTLNRASAGGTVSVANGATLALGANTGGQSGSNFPSNFSSVSLGATSTIEYNGSNAITQTVYNGATYGKLTLTNGSGSGSANKITTGNITVNGNLTINANTVLTPAAANTVGGTGTLTGSGTATVNRTTATADFSTQYPISNKTLTNLTVDYSATGAQTVNAYNYYNLIISGSRSTNNVTLASSGTIGISGTFTPSASFTSGNYVRTGSTVDFNGGSAQNIPAFTFNNLTVSNSAKTATGVINVNGAFTLNTGVVLTTTASNYLNIADNATASGASYTAYVNGPVRKTGNDAFTFPVGKSGTGYMPVGISAPANTTDAFTAEYMRSPATTLGSITAIGLNFVSNCDYWKLDRTTGSSNIDLTLSWNGYSNCNTAAYVTDLPTLTIAHFNGTNWDTHGKNSTTGNVSSGTITRNTVMNYSPFALGSTGGSSNPLNTSSITLRTWSARSPLQLEWINFSETAIAYYTIERAEAGGSYHTVYRQAAEYNDGRTANYQWQDETNFTGAANYKVSAISFDGRTVASNTIHIGTKNGTSMLVYPNPVTGNKLSLQTAGLAAGTYRVKLMNMPGDCVLDQTLILNGISSATPVILPATISKGIYRLHLSGMQTDLFATLILQ